MKLPEDYIKKILATLRNHDSKSPGFENVFKNILASLPDIPGTAPSSPQEPEKVAKLERCPTALVLAARLYEAFNDSGKPIDFLPVAHRAIALCSERIPARVFDLVEEWRQSPVEGMRVAAAELENALHASPQIDG